MKESMKNLYPEHEAYEEASLMREKIKSGEAKNEKEAEIIIERDNGFEIKQDLLKSLNIIKQTGLFSDDFLDKSTLVIFGKKRTHRFKGQEIREVSHGQFSEQDFMQGKRVDFIGINPKNEFEKFIETALKNKPVLEIIFLKGKLTFDEFIAHEIAHNIFDIQYIQKIGRYKETDNITDVSENYREKIKEIIIPLVEKHYPNIEIEKFSFRKQQITEIFAMLYEREFCRRNSSNMEMHSGVEERVTEFFDNPEKAIAEFNKKNKRNFTMNYLYEENHILSIIAAPLLEKEYPAWGERIDIFWK